MEHRYLVVKEWCDTYDECRFGYPQIWSYEPVAICETKESAEKLIERFLQTEADRFMDWLDVCKDYLDAGLTDVSEYYDEDRADYYSIEKVPYFTDAS